MRLIVPIRTISEANRSLKEHWGARIRRVKKQREAVAWAWATLELYVRMALPLQVQNEGITVTLTRIAPRTLDTDNLSSSLKAVRDEVAKQLGVDDGSESIEWRYSQVRGRSKEYAVQIEITPGIASGARERAS